MKDIFSVWKNTKLIVLTSIIAAFYAAILIPFKPIPIIPGYTELRPANAIPIICSLLFGPAASWGSAFGNLIGDFFGTLGPGSFFGFIGNFLYGYLPYKLWIIITGNKELKLNKIFDISIFVFISLISSLVCAIVIGWGLELLGLVPFKFLTNVIVINNFLMSVSIGYLLLLLIYPRLKSANLLYITSYQKNSTYSFIKKFLILLLTILSISGIVIGNLTSSGVIPYSTKIIVSPIVVLLIITSLAL